MALRAARYSYATFPNFKNQFTEKFNIFRNFVAECEGILSGATEGITPFSKVRKEVQCTIEIQ